MQNAFANLRRLRHVMAIARHESFARAAQELHITQSALSRSVQSLEEQLGFRLFDRGRRGAATTAAGATFMRSAATMLETADMLEESLQSLASRPVRQVNFGIGPFPAAVLLPPLFTVALAQGAATRMGVHMERASVLLTLLGEGEIEFFLAAEGTIEPKPFLLSENFLQLSVDLRVREGHPLAQLTGVTHKQMDRFPPIGGGIWKQGRTAAMPMRVAQYDPVIACDSYHILAETLRHSDAVCAFPALFRTPGLVSIDCAPAAMPHDVPIQMMRLSGKSLSSGAIELLDKIRAVEAALPRIRPEIRE